jgi:hypothetical protein
LATFDLIGRSAEALQRLKPQELRALWLRAQGHSYNDIGVMTGWSYTKVNRCLTEGRRSFLARYADIESGAECERWLPVISAMVDGEATSDQLVELRPHLRNCPGCRATLRTLQDSSAPLAAVMPIPLIAATADSAEHVSNLLMRIYEVLVGGLHDRAATSITKVQAVVEATTAGKAAAIAGAAAAVASGSYATVERSVDGRRVERGVDVQHVEGDRRPMKQLPANSINVSRPARTAPGTVAPQIHRGEFRSVSPAKSRPAPEFESAVRRLQVVASGGPSYAPSHVRDAQPDAPEFTPRNPPSAPEFGP